MNPPKMPLHIGDYLRDTRHLRAAAHGAYFLLIMHYWSTGGLPDDDDQLSAIACMTRSEWKHHRPILAKFFKPGWKHKRIESELAAAKASYEKRASAGEKGGKSRAEPKQCLSNATAGLEQCSSNLKPLTLNQEPEEKKERSLRSRSAHASGSLLSDDWTLSSDDSNFAFSLGMRFAEVETEAAKFRDYWRSKAGPGAVKRDWSATWRNWCRKEIKDGKTDNGSKKSGSILDVCSKLEEHFLASGDDFAASHARLLRLPKD